ncbi:MAG: hypothetical protein ABEI13_01340, partial [Candidatus Paceibacteria bacterium]
MMQNENPNNQDPGFFGRIKEFFADHKQTLFPAIIIVLLIGAGIYVFNNDNSTQTNTDETEVVANDKENTKGEEGTTIYEGEANTDESSESSEENSNTKESNESEAPGETIYEGSPSDSDTSSDETSSENAENNASSTSYSMTATEGDGVTHLARRAIAQYLEENPEQAEQITPAHKIYMETVLTQNNYQASLDLGETVTFSQ